MLNHIKTLIREDRGTITADWMTLAGGVVTLTLVLVASVQQDVTMRVSKIQPAFSVTSSFN